MAGLKQADHHVPGDAHLMGVLGTKDAGKAAREATIGEVSRDRRGEMSRSGAFSRVGMADAFHRAVGASKGPRARMAAPR